MHGADTYHETNEQREVTQSRINKGHRYEKAPIQPRLFSGGQGRIRTIEDISRRIYSPQHLTALQPAPTFQLYGIIHALSIIN